MNPEMLAKMNKAFAAKVISKEEYEHILAKEKSNTKEKYYRKEVPIIDNFTKISSREPKNFFKNFFTNKHLGVYAVIIILAIIAIILGNGITGFVTQETTLVTQTNIIANQSTSIPLTLTNINSLSIGGNLIGQAKVYLSYDNTTKLIYEGDSTITRYAIYTDKISYLVNDTVNVTITPDINYTLWLNKPNGEKVPVNNGFVVSKIGEYTIDALIDGETIIKKSISFIVSDESIIREFNIDQINFNDCIETCSIENTGDSQLYLIINLTNSSIEITNITTTEPRANNPPELVNEIPNQTGNVTINLDDYFVDPDADNLIYEINNMIGVDENIIGSELSLSGNIPGTYNVTIYASDLIEIISTSFIYTVEENIKENLENNINNSNLTLENETNIIINTDLDTTNNGVNTSNNISVNTTNEPTTNITTNITFINDTNCDDPNPNNRAPSCLNSIEDIFEESMAIENLDRIRVAKITPIGNFMITGEVFEYDNGSPGLRDFRIGYVDRDGKSVATIWIDKEGNLHLKGKLYEENGNLKPAPGSYSLINKRSIYMAWANTANGDLHIRGNVIPFRKPEVILE